MIITLRKKHNNNIIYIYHNKIHKFILLIIYYIYLKLHIIINIFIFYSNIFIILSNKNKIMGIGD